MSSESLSSSEELEIFILEFEELNELNEEEELEEEELEDNVLEDDETEWELSESSSSLSSPSSKPAKWVFTSSLVASKIPQIRACHSDK